VSRSGSTASRLLIRPMENCPEKLLPAESVKREAKESGLPPSIFHRFSSGHVSTSLIWGRNKDLESHGRRIFNAYTAESTVNFLIKNWAWTRIENVDRDRTLLAGETPAALLVEEAPIGRVQAYTFGYERDLPIGVSAVKVGLGARFTTYGLSSQMKSIYGNRPAAFSVFLRIHPTGNAAAHMQMMHGH